MIRFLSIFYLIYVLSFQANLCSSGTVTQVPSYACAGDDVTVECELTLPDPINNFRSNFINFIVGNINVSLTDIDVNSGTGDNGGVDLSRLTAVANNSFSGDKIIRGSITLSSYTASDAGIRLGCSAVYFLSGSSGDTTRIMDTDLLTPAAPPSAPSLQSSVSNFNTATCSANISLTWNTPPSNRTVDRYFLYLDGSPITTTNSNSYIHSTFLNINTDYQYSVTAMSCAGNSTLSPLANSIRIANYSLIKSPQFTCLAYNNDTGTLKIDWGLSTPTLPSGVSGLDITYSLQLLYSYSRQGVTYRYTDSTSFTLPSSQLSYNTVLTAHNFTQLDGVETNITANLTIVQQCGQSFSGTAMECFFKSTYSNNLIPSIPSPTQSTPTPTPPSSSNSFSSSQGLTTPSNDATDQTSILPIIIGSAVGGVSVILSIFIILLVFIIIIIIIIIIISKKEKGTKPTGSGVGSDLSRNHGQHRNSEPVEDEVIPNEAYIPNDQPNAGLTCNSDQNQQGPAFGSCQIYDEGAHVKKDVVITNERAHVKKDEKDLTYAQLNLLPQSNPEKVKPPINPTTHYTEIFNPEN